METIIEKQIKCKQCGNVLDPNTAVEGIVVCEYCYNKYTVAINASKEVQELLLMASDALDKCKFDDAYAAYNKVAELSPKEPEAYFGMALAEHKVQYLKDFRKKSSGERFRLQPICHEIAETKFSENKNYFKAISLATPAQFAEYQQKANELDHIRAEFLRLKKTGVDYDCFICVKVTDETSGHRTRDYKLADDIYFALKGKGYKPFFSERELTDEVGADYEAFVLYALYMSECMIVVCGDEQYLETPWVKNEYTRFIGMINDEYKESGSIAIAFSGAPIERLPGRAGKLQGINLSSLGAMEQITGFVDKYYADNGSKKKNGASGDEAEKYRAKLQAKQTIQAAKAQAKQEKWKARQAELQAMREAKQEELTLKQTELELKRVEKAKKESGATFDVDSDRMSGLKSWLGNLGEIPKKFFAIIGVIMAIFIGFTTGVTSGIYRLGEGFSIPIFFGGFVASIFVATPFIKRIRKDGCTKRQFIKYAGIDFAVGFAWGFMFMMI